MSINQNCAESMVMAAALRCLNLEIEFNYPNKVADKQLDISTAFILSDDKQKQVLTSGKTEESFITDLNKLNKEKTYFLRTGTNDGAGHYQLLYFDDVKSVWQSYSSDTNNYLVTTSAGKLTRQAKSSLLTPFGSWGKENGQYSFLLVEASLENIIRSANYIYDIRTTNQETADLNAFSEQLEWRQNIVHHEIEPIAVKETSIDPAKKLSSKVEQNEMHGGVSTRPDAFFKIIDNGDTPVLTSNFATIPSKSTLSVEQQLQIRSHINILGREINSCWPYLNKARKQIKLDALQQLLERANTGENLANVVQEIKGIPGVMDGAISQRTSTLLNQLRELPIVNILS